MRLKFSGNLVHKGYLYSWLNQFELDLKMNESHIKFKIGNIYDKQDFKKKKDYGLYIVLSLVGVLILTAIVLLPIFLSNISHGKKKHSGYYIRNNRANKFIDLHLHLDGAITLDIAKKLASL